MDTGRERELQTPEEVVKVEHTDLVQEEKADPKAWRKDKVWYQNHQLGKRKSLFIPIPKKYMDVWFQLLKTPTGTKIHMCTHKNEGGVEKVPVHE